MRNRTLVPFSRGICSRKSTEPLQFIKSLGRFLITWKIQTLGNSRGRILLGKKDSGGSFQTKLHFLLSKRQIYLLIDPLEKPPAGGFIALRLQWSAVI